MTQDSYIKSLRAGKKHIFIISASATILEELSSSPTSSEENISKSYLSVKRASLKKRLRLKTISSKSEAEDTGRTTIVDFKFVYKILSHFCHQNQKKIQGVS